MEDSTASSPSGYNSQWEPPPPYAQTPAYSFQHLDGSLIPWHGPQPPQSLFLTEPQYADPYCFDTTLSFAPLEDLPSTSNFLSCHGITSSEPSSNEAEQLRPFPLFPNHDAAHLLPGGGGGDAVLAQHEQQYQEQLTGPQARGYPMHSSDSPVSAKAPDFKKNPEAMRTSWMADYGRFIDGTKVLKVFSKQAKDKVATLNTLKASAARRKGPAKFKCSIAGCGADFTRKHNLENHLKSHCGVTDRICAVCGKGFTTIPVCKRHQRTCEKAASSSKAASPKEFLDAVTAQLPS